MILINYKNWKGLITLPPMKTNWILQHVILLLNHGTEWIKLCQESKELVSILLWTVRRNSENRINRTLVWPQRNLRCGGTASILWPSQTIISVWKETPFAMALNVERVEYREFQRRKHGRRKIGSSFMSWMSGEGQMNKQTESKMEQG